MNKIITEEERKKIFYEEYNKSSNNTKYYINDLMIIVDDLFHNTHYSANVRYYYCYAFRKLNMTYKNIGKWFALDHSTIIKGINNLIHSIYITDRLMLKKIDKIYNKHYGEK